jgi:hypothetical protein
MPPLRFTADAMRITLPLHCRRAILMPLFFASHCHYAAIITLSAADFDFSLPPCLAKRRGGAYEVAIIIYYFATFRCQLLPLASAFDFAFADAAISILSAAIFAAD